MKFAKAATLALSVAMFGSLVYAFISGDIRKEGAQLVKMPWGIVSLVDVYVGFSLFSGWVIYREKSLARSIPIVAAIMILGNWVAALYAFIALQRSSNNWKRFWMGENAD